MSMESEGKTIDLERLPEAVDLYRRLAAEEAVSLLSPYFQARPKAFAGLMRVMARVYLQQCESLGREPDAALLAPIVEGFKALEAGEE